MTVFNNFSDEIARVFSTALRDTKPLEAMGLKLFEEGGELAEAINHKLGYLPHKVMKEPLVGEVVDVINTALTVFVKAYPELTRDEQLELLTEHLFRKSMKWKQTMNSIELTQGVL